SPWPVSSLRRTNGSSVGLRCALPVNRAWNGRSAAAAAAARARTTVTATTVPTNFRNMTFLLRWPVVRYGPPAAAAGRTGPFLARGGGAGRGPRGAAAPLDHVHAPGARDGRDEHVGQRDGLRPFLFQDQARE